MNHDEFYASHVAKGTLASFGVPGLAKKTKHEIRYRSTKGTENDTDILVLKQMICKELKNLDAKRNYNLLDLRTKLIDGEMIVNFTTVAFFVRTNRTVNDRYEKPLMEYLENKIRELEGHAISTIATTKDGYHSKDHMIRLPYNVDMINTPDYEPFKAFADLFEKKLKEEVSYMEDKYDYHMINPAVRLIGDEMVIKFTTALFYAHETRYVTTCVYCGEEYPSATLGGDTTILKGHISTCKKHPLSAALKRIKELEDVISCQENTSVTKE